MFEKEKKYFPIKTKTACALKWGWSSIQVNRGVTNSCHRCKAVPLEVENFDNFHNLPHKIKERKIMLSGKWPTEQNGGSGHCNYCKKIEDVGGTSDRLQHLTIPNMYPEELDNDPTATSVTPTILELFLSNKCNLKCTYCYTRHSSKINSETKQYGPLKDINNEIIRGYEIMEDHKDTDLYLQKTLLWLEKNSHKLKRLNLLGGETFYQSEFDLILEALAKNQNRELDLNIVSNFMTKEEIFKSKIEKIRELIMNKHIGRLSLTASIDGWGEEAEYARTGLKCDYWYKLFEWCVMQKWIVLHTNQTITSLTVKSIPKLLQVINSFKKQKHIETQFGLVTGRDWMHPNVYGQDFWQKDFSVILNSMVEENYRDKVLKDYMRGIFQQLPKKQPDKIMIAKLHHFLDSLDKRRGTDWRSVYPYLDI